MVVLSLTLLLGAAPTTREATEPTTLPPLSTVAEPALASVEEELVQLTREGRSIPDANRARHALRIDLRILQRHLLQLASEAEETDATRIALLRAADLEALAAGADDFARRATGSPVSADAAEALAALHECTFDLAGKSPDATLDGVGLLVLRATGQPAQTLPVLRPSVSPSVAAAPNSNPLAIDQMASRLRSLSVSAPLRDKLAELIATTKQVSGAERRRIEATLQQAFALAEGLARNAGVATADERRGVEVELLDALTLLEDERLRDLGERKMSELAAYADLVGATADLPAGDRTFDPLLSAARQNPARAAEILSAVRRYYAESRRYHESAPKAEVVSEAVGPRWGRGVERLRTQFELRRDRFRTAASEFGQADSTYNATIDDFTYEANELRRLNDLLVAVATAPASADRLEQSAKVTPTDGLERAAASAVVKVDDPGKDDERDAADAVLLGLARLATEWNRHEALAAQLSTDTDGAELAARHEALVKQAGRELASGREVPGDWYERLDTALMSIDRAAAAMAEAAALRETVDRAADAWPWADWSVDRERLVAIYDGYHRMLSRAVSAAGSEDAASAWDRFAEERERLSPMTSLLREVVAAADGVPAPDGHWSALAARAQTPSAGAPFAAQRYVSVALRRLPKAIDRDAALDELLATLRHEYGYE